ncbi:MAG: GAF domain-containing protein [Nostoc sp. ChiSLP02]|nr:GAF domain-containing protein [Nostoc sp. DedSLP05]MDZ8101401.1 GAF domain-containing protein [Nostoc sp. DedSLP01]MDZ8185277.1 GAF domain-containing protein [Nostoc sp. ChiSLP02]
MSEIPFQYKTQHDALKRITELGKQFIDSHTFAIALINTETKVVNELVCTSNNLELEELINNEKLLWNEIVLYKQGKLHPDIRKKYYLKSIHSYPLWSQESKVVGYIYHFSSIFKTLNKQEQGLLKSFASRAIVTIENLNYNYNTYKPLQVLCKLSEQLMTVAPDEFIQLLPQKACELFEASACILWKKDIKHQKFKILATAGKVDDEYKNLELNDNFHLIQNFYHRKEVFYLRDITRASANFLHYEEVKKRGWISMLSSPLMSNGEIIGILDIFTTKNRHFKKLEKEGFQCFSNYAALSFEKAVTNQKTKELTEIMLKMINCDTAKEVFQRLIDGAINLLDSGHGDISRLNYFTGELEVIESIKPLKKNFTKWKIGEGITGKALELKETINVGNVLTDSRWKDIYVEYWPDTRSEIAIPILIENILVRKGTEVELGSKRLGVLNIESPEINAFSKADEEYLKLLARYAAILIDRRESDKKLSELRQKEQQITEAQNHNQIMENVLKSITDILQFEVVNISLVNRETNTIKTEFITGISDNQIEEFKKEAVHSLDSNDIQASIVKSIKIQVPDIEDQRFDKQIYHKYGHQDLIRVFIPLIEPFKSQVIGTLEAGYKRHYREYIYEQDVQVLKSFVDSVVHAVERTKSQIIDKITHEFRSPIVGIRSNASFIQRRREEITLEHCDRKIEDILTDCEILLYQVAELEYIMGGRVSGKSKKEKVFIFRDVIIKTINQLRPIVIDHGLSIENIDYSKRFLRLEINTDKIKINQVVYNLLMNSIKYAKDDKNQFKIDIDIDDKNKDNLIIKLKDWGIGIEKKFVNDIFKEGFRCPEAIKKNVAGSGLGLAISKNIMRELEGDLILSNNTEPTEFHLVIPRY